MSSKFMRVENKELLDFQKHFKSFSETFDKEVTQALAETAYSYLRDLTNATPINKDPKAATRGNLRKAWFKENQTLAFRVFKTGEGYTIELINSTPYASFVENGHNIYNQYGGSYGWVMGQFFVKKTEDLWENGKLNRVVQRNIGKWFRQLMGGVSNDK